MTDCTSIDAEIEKAQQELDIIAEMTHKCVDNNAAVAQDQEEYLKRYNGLVARFEEGTKQLNDLKDKRILKKAKGESFQDFIETFSHSKRTIDEFDDELWLSTIDKVMVEENGTLRFIFRNESEIEVSYKK